MGYTFTGTTKAERTAFPLNSVNLSVWGWAKAPVLQDAPYIKNESTFTFQVYHRTAPSIRLQRAYTTTNGLWFINSVGNPLVYTDWYFWAWTHDGSALPKFYYYNITGGAPGALTEHTVEINTAPVGTPVTTTSSTLIIGNNGAGTQPFGGSIGWTGVEDSVLTQAQLQDLLELTMPSVEPSGWWSLEGNTTPEQDETSNNRDMTIVGSPTFVAFPFDPPPDETQISFTGRMSVRATMDAANGPSTIGFTAGVDMGPEADIEFPDGIRISFSAGITIGVEADAYSIVPPPPPPPEPEQPSFLWDEIYKGVLPLTYADPEQSYALRTYCEALGKPFELVHWLASDHPNGLRGWEVLFSPTQAPAEVLPWMQQITGTVPVIGESPSRTRQRISNGENFRRGTVAGMEAVAIAYGLNKFKVEERYQGNPWKVRLFFVRQEHSTTIEQAIVRFLPAGLTYSIAFWDGRDYEYVRNFWTSYQQVKNNNPSYEDLRGA